MVGGSLLALLDDITTLLDDIASMTKIATKKTATMLSDDLALNTEQVLKIRARREMPIVWAVAKGSLLNKLILIPLVLIISYFAAWLVKLFLIVGGVYLCFEGSEKVFHSIWGVMLRSNKNEYREPNTTQLNNDEKQILHLEKQKIKGAIRTDFILSAEIIIIILNIVLDQPVLTRIFVLCIAGFLITVGIYGVVALILKLDDLGYWIIVKKQKQKYWFSIVNGLIHSAPYLMRFLSLFGTIAMFLVGGGIILHNIALFYEIERDILAWFKSVPEAGSLFNAVLPSILNLIAGIFIGILVCMAFFAMKWIYRSFR